MSTALRTASSPVALAGFGIAVALVAVVGALSSSDAAATYTSLRQPEWAPPSWLFGPVWTVLYVLLALVVCVWLFSRRSRAAALLQVPYLAWILFATALNTALITLN